MERYWPGRRPAEVTMCSPRRWTARSSVICGSRCVRQRTSPARAGSSTSRSTRPAGDRAWGGSWCWPLDKAKALGCTSIKLNVFGGNDVAIRLYQSLGFRTAQMQVTKQLWSPHPRLIRVATADSDRLRSWRVAARSGT